MRARKMAVTIGAAAAALALGVTIPAAVSAQADTVDAPRPTAAPPQPGELPASFAKTATKASEDRVGVANSCWYDSAWWCNNVPGAQLLDTNFNVVGHVETNPSVFACRDDSGADHGGPHPTRWVWTQADDTGAWGWMSDNDISSETETLPVC